MQKTFKRNYPKRRYRRNRRVVKKSGGGGTLSKIASIASTALSTAKFVASLVNAEYKYYDRGLSLVACTWNGIMYNMVDNISQGAGSSQRTGDSIKLKSLKIKGAIEYNPAGVTYESVRLIMFYDKENSISNATDYLQQVGSNVAPYSSKNIVNIYRTRLIFDKTVTINPTTFNIPFEFSTQLKDHIHFETASTTIKNNVIKLIIIGQSPINGPFVSFYCRTKYLDN